MNTVPELNLIIVLLNKEAFRSFFEYIDREYIKTNFKELWYIYQSLEALHESVEKDLTLDELQAFFFVKYPEADQSTYGNIFKQLSGVEIDPTVGATILNEISNRKKALVLSEAAFRYSNGTGELDKLTNAITKFGTPAETELDVEFVDTDLEYLLNETVHKRGLRWRLNFLNKSIGSLRRGDFGFIFARPETGKTTWLASEVSHMLTQLVEDNGPIVHLNNEEDGKKVMIRYYQAYFGCTLQELYRNPKHFREQFRAETNGKFLLLDDANIHRARVERIVASLKPSLIVFDQIDKIKGFQSDREDLRLGSIYTWAREIAKAQCPVIGVCQANGTGEGVEYLTMDHVANSATAKQAEADWILGIGKNHKETAEYVRYLNISKNKCQGDSDSIESMRHGRAAVLIEPTIGRYKDLKEYQ